MWFSVQLQDFHRRLGLPTEAFTYFPCILNPRCDLENIMIHQWVVWVWPWTLTDLGVRGWRTISQLSSTTSIKWTVFLSVNMPLLSSASFSHWPLTLCLFHRGPVTYSSTEVLVAAGRSLTLPTSAPVGSTLWPVPINTYCIQGPEMQTDSCVKRKGAGRRRWKRQDARWDEGAWLHTVQVHQR